MLLICVLFSEDSSNLCDKHSLEFSHGNLLIYLWTRSITINYNLTTKTRSVLENIFKFWKMFFLSIGKRQVRLSRRIAKFSEIIFLKLLLKGFFINQSNTQDGIFCENGWRPKTVIFFRKSTILDVWLGSE